MDRIAQMERIVRYIKQYRYVFLVFLLGVGLMLIPSRDNTGGEAEVEDKKETEITCEEKLSNILSQIEGVGKADVLLTIAEGEQFVYHCDGDESTGNDTVTYRQEAVIVSDADRNEQGLIQQVIPPKYQGAIIVCQGGDSASVKLCVVEAVMNVTGLTADKITVLKMK